MRRELVWIPIVQLLIREASKRHQDRNKIAKMAFSMKSTGQLNPLIVRRIPGEERYEIVAGGMRALGLKAAGETHAECVVVPPEMTDADVLKLTVTENHQRFDWDVMEFSRQVCRYMDISGANGSDAAQALGISITEVSRCRERVNDWPLELQQLAEEERVAPSTAHAIHKIEDPEKKQEAMRLAAEGKLTRDAAFSWAQESKNGRPPAEKPNVSRCKVAMEQGAVTISKTASEEGVVALLTEVLKRARKAMSRGLRGKAFALALRDPSSSKKQGASA